jgi:hypothetical protein
MRSCHTGEASQEAVCGVDVDDRDAQVPLEDVRELGRLVPAQEAVIHEDTGES